MSRLKAILPAVVVTACNTLPRPDLARLCAMVLPAPGDGVVTTGADRR